MIPQFYFDFTLQSKAWLDNILDSLPGHRNHQTGETNGHVVFYRIGLTIQPIFGIFLPLPNLRINEDLISTIQFKPPLSDKMCLPGFLCWCQAAQKSGCKVWLKCPPGKMRTGTY